MNEDNKSKIGVLKIVAKTKGIMFEDEDGKWYNGFDEKAKGMVKAEFKGKQVEINLSDDGKYISCVCLEDVKIDVIKEEVVSESIKKESKVIVSNEKVTEPKAPPMFGFGSADKLKSDMISCYDLNEYGIMKNTKVETAKKGNLTYASWAEVWGKLKELHPTSTFIVHENKETGMPYIGNDNVGYFVKVSVNVMNVTHTVHLPVMDNRNKSVKADGLDSMVINKSIQRCFAKAIAMHGIGLYVYKGEDFPEEESK